MRKNFTRCAGAAVAALLLGIIPCQSWANVKDNAPSPVASAENAAAITKSEFLARLAAAAQSVSLTVPQSVAANFKGTGTVKYEAAAQAIVETFGLSYGTPKNPKASVALLLRCGLTDGVKASLGENLTVSDAEMLLANAAAYQKMLADDRTQMEASRQNLMNRHRLARPRQAKRLKHSSVRMTGAMNYSVATMAETGIVDSAAATAMKAPPAYCPPPCPVPLPNTESYQYNEENVFKKAITSPLSTFSIDTDTASYSNLRRFITRGEKIPAAAIRTEELINYFDYDYPLPTGDAPFSVITEISQCPWNTAHRLALVALRGAELQERRPSNLTFLVDVSGSMYSQEKLPLVKRSLNLLLDKLLPDDTISLVTYASGVATILDGVKATERQKIKEAFDGLVAYGGTSGADGLNLAYKVAGKHKVKGNNRIILCTDGDFNIGPSSDAEMLKLIEEKREQGIFMSVLGFGMGNYKDSKMEIIADKGNGNYAYIDNIREAKKVLVDDMTKTIYAIAKDVKLQIEFNPAVVAEYRLIGYENRVMQTEDFDNDKKDAGELGAGSTVTALYELILNEGAAPKSDLHFSEVSVKGGKEPFFVKLRYKEPDGDVSKLLEKAVENADQPMSENMRWASAVAELGLILTDSPYKGTANFDSVITRAKTAYGADDYGIRHEFVQLVDLLKYSGTGDTTQK